ncbi:refilin B [Rhinichthys klamathensis goyatoka]|uniref:refilin B n=1 Tax=Rhinichthys klamathensis goyatoka TaxID=3034132 RepID=UPI0024B4ACBB|nr:refilin B [Rhinichthys klamathensis goyatoka]
MVGRLNLRNVSDDDPLDMNFKADRPLDSPDSGLPPSPSPSPSVWLLQGTGAGTPITEDESRGTAVVPNNRQLHALSYGEGIELDPLPLKEIRYTSSVRYDSDRHFIQDVTLQPKGLGLEMCSQTVLALPQSTWRHYKTQLEFQPRQRVQRYQSTTIVYPKHTRTFYTTQLNYDGHKLTKRFFSAVELQASDCKAGL